MPYACESLVKKLWHATPSMRPTMQECLTALQGVLEVLPGDSLSRSMPLDTLDSLDALAGLNINKSRPGTAARR